MKPPTMSGETDTLYFYFKLHYDIRKMFENSARQMDATQANENKQRPRECAVLVRLGYRLPTHIAFIASIQVYNIK